MKRKGEFVCENCSEIADLYKSTCFMCDCSEEFEIPLRSIFFRFFRFFLEPPQGIRCADRDCPKKAYLRRCNKCENFVSAYLGARNLAISIIGHKNAGKTEYISALAKRFFPEEGAVKTSNEAGSPNGKNVVDFHYKNALLRFFDEKGRDYDSVAEIVKRDYIFNSDGIIIFLDFNALGCAEGGGVRDFLSAIINSHRKKKKLVRGKVDTPVAVVISKIYLNNEENNFWLKYRDSSKLIFDLKTLEAVDSKSRGLLKQFDHGDIVKIMEANFNFYSLFCISSMEDIGIAHPIKWLLWKFNSI